MSCNRLNGSLTSSLSGLQSHSLAASFRNDINPKQDRISLGMIVNPQLLEATISASLSLDYNEKLGEYYTQSFHFYELQGNVSDPIQLSLCSFGYTPQP